MANTGNTQQQIDYGTSANDGTGDALRVAFIKTDENFDNIWLAGPVGSNITIANNTVQVNNTNGNLILSPNGIGVIQTNSRLLPRLNNTYDFGSTTLKYRTGYFGAGGLVIDGNVTVAGNLTAGNIAYTGNVFVGDLQGSVYADDSTIMVDAVDNELFAGRATISGNVSATYFTGNGSLLTGIATSYGNANVVANLAALGNNPISTTGNVTANYFLGNGRQLTGVVSSYGNTNVAAYLTTYTGNLAAGNLTVSSGSDTWTMSGQFLTGPGGAYWHSHPEQSSDDFVSAPGSDITIQSVDANSVVESQISLTSSNIEIIVVNGVTKTWRFDESGTSEIPGDIVPVVTVGASASVGNIANPWNNAYISGNINSGNVSAAGNVTASYFIGNGSQLTSLPAPAVTQDITSNGAMSIMTYDGVIKYVSYATVEPASGNITGGNILTGGLISATGNIRCANVHTGILSATGNITGGNVSTGIITLTNGAVIKDTAGEAVAFGQGAGNTTQGTSAVAIGTQAGQITQGEFAVAIGDNAGNNAQGTDAVAIGASAGLNTQGNGAVALGQGTGEISQGANAVALGKAAGQVNQGVNSVAIGQSAGLTNQGNNSIILNATGSALDQTTANTFTVAPVRNDVANVAQVMFYNTTSKEITYGNTISVAGNITANNIGLTGNGVVSFTSGSTLSFGDVPVTNRYYVDATRTDTYTANGSQARPFKTIAAAQAAIATAISGGLNPEVEPIYIILLSNIAENVSLTTNHVYLIGQNGQIHQPIILTGNITVNPTSGTLNSNHFSITGMEIVGGTNGKAIYVTGTSPLRLSLQDVWITANGTGAGLYQDNTGTGTYTHGGPLKVSHNGSGDVYCFDIRKGTASFDTVETSGATQVGAAGPGATLTFNNSQLDANGDVVVETYGNGTLVVTNSVIKNTAANSYGIKLNAVANVAGTVSVGQSAFNVPSGTGQAVWLDPNTTPGLSGVFAWSGASFYPNTNTTIAPLVIPAPLAILVGTIASPILYGDITSYAVAQDWDLIDNNASALSFDTTGKAGVLELVTTNSAEGVKMSGYANVVGNVTGGNILTGGLVSATGNITGGNIVTAGNVSGNTAGFAIGYREQ
jgi:hypothetical protein